MSDNLPSKNEYGEPWVDSYGANENVLTDKDKAERAAVCVDALAGCPDPEAFVEAARKLMDLVKDKPVWPVSQESIDAADALSWLRVQNKSTKEGESE